MGLRRFLKIALMSGSTLAALLLTASSKIAASDQSKPTGDPGPQNKPEILNLAALPPKEITATCLTCHEAAPQGNFVVVAEQT